MPGVASAYNEGVGTMDFGSMSAAQVRGSMVYVPAGTFRMGSDKHYPEEAPAHRVTVDGFWIDRTPVTNRKFRKFVEATGHVTFAEIAPDPKDYPSALPHMLRAGSLVFDPPDHPVDLGNFASWWTFKFGANWRLALWQGQLDPRPR
jgi:formylglycine-generating enzyme